MINPLLERLERSEGKKLYGYQLDSIDTIFDRFSKNPANYNLLFQLPTGGGKTVIFAELAKRFILETHKKVLILTHRIELLAQTSRMLNDIGVNNKIINSKIKDLPDEHEHLCFVAMVETLNNRLSDEKMELENLGLVIIDEAHYNSFRKLFKFFEDQIILGVTATPLSSNIKLPLKDNYQELIVGESIQSLIKKGFLSQGNTYSYDVNLRSLKIGINGDYTVSSSERLYGNFFMQEKLLYAYEEKAKGSKTLIFNNGIATSKQVYALFKEAGHEIMHLDNTHSEKERADILEWFHTKKDAILTSVSILTTGFDEPEVSTVILNRATKSLTLYHQMIGRGSRVLPSKKEFNIIDLGNNARRFGLWENHINWQDIFRNPNSFIDGLYSDEEIEKEFVYDMPEEVRVRFLNSVIGEFDIKEEYHNVMKAGGKARDVIQLSINEHTLMVVENGEDLLEALELIKLLDKDIEFRIKQYSYCISKTTESYLTWLQTEYRRKLEFAVRQHYF
ncbi:MAG: DEAD/DEAH box helicase [Cryomorphaceae bacterium]|nr:DEAD/DEAH box helicase [Cryomorphaceae bacterium]